MKRTIFLIAIWLICFTSSAAAHPVSFKGGYGIMPTLTPQRQELELNYSLTNNQAIGFNTIHLEYKERDLTFALPQFSYRIYRRNEVGSQMNVYGTIGAGVAHYDENRSVAGIAAFQADYETRRIYTLFAGEHLQGGESIGLNRARYRFGVAPYLAPFEGFHTWLIGQVEYTPELDEEMTVTPMLRFFYKNYLVELGVSTRGDPFVAGIFHF